MTPSMLSRFAKRALHVALPAASLRYMSESFHSVQRVFGRAVGFAFAVELASCQREPLRNVSNPSGEQTRASAVVADASATAPQRLPTAVLDRETLPTAATTEGEVRKPGSGLASLALGLDLLRELSESRGENVVVSPLSILWARPYYQSQLKLNAQWMLPANLQA